MHQKLVFIPCGCIHNNVFIFLINPYSWSGIFLKIALITGYLLASFSWVLTSLPFLHGLGLDWTTSSAWCPVPVNKHSRGSDLSTVICPTPLQPNVIPTFEIGPLLRCQFSFRDAIDSRQSALTDTSAISKFLILQPRCTFFLQMPYDE